VTALRPAPAVEAAVPHLNVVEVRGHSIMQHLDGQRAAGGASSGGSSPASGPSQPVSRGRSRSEVPRLQLNDGNGIPQLGFGAWQIEDAAAPAVVGAAIDAGYRLIDTATNYGNEFGVGKAIRRAFVPRNELFVTTKLWNEFHGYDQAMRAFDASAARLKLDMIDLYLIHWPCPQRGAYVDTWRALIELRRQGRVRSIGVSNFAADHLKRIIDETGVVPAVNQIELHPAFQQASLRELHNRYGIVTQAWSPLGHGASLIDPRFTMIADRLGRTPAQVVLRWHIENGFVVIPKSATPSRIAENIDVFGFELTTGDHAVIAGLDRTNGRIGPNPMRFGRMGFARRLLNRVSVASN
jgi:2,5-diketo-D-gluconate reductase A